MIYVLTIFRILKKWLPFKFSVESFLNHAIVPLWRFNKIVQSIPNILLLDINTFINLLESPAIKHFLQLFFVIPDLINQSEFIGLALK